VSLSISSRFPVTTSERRSADDQSCCGPPHLAYLTDAGHRVTGSPSPTLPRTGSRGPWSTSQRHTLWSVCVMPLQHSELGTARTPSPGASRPVGDPMFRSRGTYRARRRCPIYDLQYPHWASPITQGIPRTKVESVARDGVGIQTCYRRGCRSTAGHEGSGNPALTLSRRRCRTMPYTSSAISRFPIMLLFPILSESGKMSRLEVICLELRPPLVAIHSVRTMAHTPRGIRLAREGLSTLSRRCASVRCGSPMRSSSSVPP
jgi:hypothetical protein